MGCTWARLCICMLQSKPLNVEYLMMDASVLLPPTGTPLTGIDFVKRLPCGDVEKTRRVCKLSRLIKTKSAVRISLRLVDTYKAWISNGNIIFTAWLKSYILDIYQTV